MSPESVVSSHWRSLFRDRLSSAVSFVAVDEAHCIVSWGLDFRPAYSELGYLRAVMKCPVLALSATLPSHAYPIQG